MILTLAWKEFREHRAIWLTMVIVTSGLGIGLGNIHAVDFPPSTFALAILGMAATYGVVCGSMMLAGEREGGTLTLLDIFLGRRDLLWIGKFSIGALFVILEALAVATALYFADLVPPDWMTALLGRSGGPPRVGIRPPTTSLWFAVLPIVTLEAYVWGMLGSALMPRVIAGAAIAAVIATPFWSLAIAFPAPASTVFRLVEAAAVLGISFAVFLNQAWDTPFSPVVAPMEPDPRRLWVPDWEMEMDRQPRIQEPAWTSPAEPLVVVPIDEYRPKRRRRDRPPAARSPQEVLLWLAMRQAGVAIAFMAAGGLIIGLALPSAGQVLWPLATMLLGVVCGTLAFSFEQSDLSYQFLAAQHFPLKSFWNVKILFWLTVSGAMALIAAVAAILFVAVAQLIAPPPVWGNPAPQAPNFRLGTMPHILGPTLFLGMWLVYGFCVGQLFVLLCRKTIYAIMLSGMISLGALALWMPSLLCRGMTGWQVWIPPLVLLVATRVLLRAWAAGRIKERSPLAALTGFMLAALVWVALNYGYRAWEIPDVGEPMDRVAFRESIPKGQANLAVDKIREALSTMDRPAGDQDHWLRLMTEVTQLPVGAIEPPSPDGHMPLLRHLPECRIMTDRLRTLANAARQSGNASLAFDHLAKILALSRNLRNKAAIASYLEGVEVENLALEGLEQWLAERAPPADVLQKVLEELNRHAAETPPPLDCLETECFRAAGTLTNPSAWSFHTGGRGVGGIPENWLAGGIALSLETPWESERAQRLWRVAWAGMFRAIQAPPEASDPQPLDDQRIDIILRGWAPAADGPSASVNFTQLARLLKDSWVGDDRLIVAVAPLRSAATYSRWRVDSARLAVALGLHELRNGKPAANLQDLMPKLLAELPVDPYSGKAFQYRISAGERLEGVFGNKWVQAGQRILWSTGPDRVDDGGRKHGGRPAADERNWPSNGFDLVTLAPRWPR